MGLVVRVARRLGVGPEELEREAVRLWLRRRLRLVEAEIASILGRYGASSIEELEARIRRGEAPEHPGWEDLIVLEALVGERERIIEVLKRVEEEEGAAQGDL